MKVFDRWRTIIIPASKEDERPKYAANEHTPIKHYAVEKQQQQQSWIWPRGKPVGWLR